MGLVVVVMRWGMLLLSDVAMVWDTGYSHGQGGRLPGLRGFRWETLTFIGGAWKVPLDMEIRAVTMMEARVRMKDSGHGGDGAWRE